MFNRLLIITILLVSTNCFAQEPICHNPLNVTYSFRDLYDLTFTEKDASEFNDTCIKGSNFYQFNKPGTVIFPSDVKNLEFVKCNLDNVKLPDSSIDSGGNSNRMIKLENDKEDWIIDVNGDPVEPVNKERFEQLGLSVKPEDIPAKEQDIPITVTAEHETGK